jgi:hypothetical protein
VQALRKSRGGSDALEMLACGYSSADRARKVYALIQSIPAFGDESEGTIFSLTSCILEFDKWKALSDEWDSVLKEDPRIEHFHMKEARNFDGEFLGFSPIERDYKIIRLTSAVMKFRPRLLTTWARQDEYQEVIGSPAYELRTPYFPCFLYMLWWAAYQSRMGKEKLPIDFTFDEKGKTGLAALQWFHYAKAAAPPDVAPYFGATPIFRDDENLIGLQVADLAAWHVHRKLEIPGRDPERVPTERIDELDATDKQLTKHNIQHFVSSFADVYDKPLFFLMQIKPSKRKVLWKKIQKKYERQKTKMTKNNPEFDKFEDLARQVLKASKDEVSKKLDAEKAAKKPAKKRASDRASDDNG